MDGGLHKNHRARMRKRYIENGLGAFNEHEALELLLYYCYPRRDTNEIAHRMINAFGSLSGLMDAEVPDIMRVCGVTENVAVLINIIPALAGLYAAGKLESRVKLGDARAASGYIMPLYTGFADEVFYLLSLDAQRRLIHASRIAEGSPDETNVSPRAIVNEALLHRAASVILTHNHPGGSLKPSRRDLESTAAIVEGLRFINIEVLDHIITAGGQYYSFAARGQHVAGY